jgi:carboxylesterase type B
MEGTLFALEQYASSSPANATAADYAAFLSENFGSSAALIEKYYPVSAFQAAPYPAFFAMATVITDATYFCPARRGLQATRAAGQHTWTYLFAHRPTCIWIAGIPQQALPLLGAAHTAEIPFVFGHTQNLPSPNGTCNMSPDEVQLSKYLVKAWTTMAEQQRPADSSAWPQWTDPKSSLGINIVNSSAPGFVNYTQCELWDQIRAISLAEAGNSTNTS